MYCIIEKEIEMKGILGNVLVVCMGIDIMLVYWVFFYVLLKVELYCYLFGVVWYDMFVVLVECSGVLIE